MGSEMRSQALLLGEIHAWGLKHFKDMTLEEYLALNAGVGIVWEEEIGKLNPYLSPRRVDEQQEGESREEAGEGKGSVEA